MPLFRISRHIFDDARLAVHSRLLDLSELLLAHGLHLGIGIAAQILGKLLRILELILGPSSFVLQSSFLLGNGRLAHLLSELDFSILGSLPRVPLGLALLPRFGSVVRRYLGHDARCSLLRSELPISARYVPSLGLSIYRLRRCCEIGRQELIRWLK